MNTVENQEKEQEVEQDVYEPEVVRRGRERREEGGEELALGSRSSVSSPTIHHQLMT